MKEKLKKLLGIARPGGFDDIVVRAAKTAVAVLLASPVADALKAGDPVALVSVKGAVLAALAAFASALLNAALVRLAKFANS